MNAIESLPAVVDLLPHRGEMLLLDRVLVVDEPGVTVLAHAGGQTWYADTSNTMPAWIGIELMAQAIAAHVGWRKAQRGLLPQRGVLLGTRAYHCDTHFFEGELEIDANLSFIDESGLGAYRCAIRMGGAVVATANLKVFEPEDFEQFLNAQIFNASMGVS